MIPTAVELPQVIISWFNALDTWQQIFLLIAGSLTLAKTVESVGFRIVNHYTKTSETKLDDLFVKLVRIPLYATILLGALHRIVGLLATGQAVVYVEQSIFTTIILLWSWAIFQYGNDAVDLIQNESVAQDIAPLVSNIISVFVVLGSTFLVLTIWNIDITPFIASAGVLGIVLGFAAREALANLIGGVALYFDDTYRVGDVIELESGQRGTVKDVGIRSTTIVTRDNIQINIPNSVLNNTRVINQSAPETKQRVTIPVGVEYGVELEQVDEILADVCEETDDILGSPSPRIHLLEFGDSALQYQLRVYTAHPFNENRVRNAVNRRIYERFNEANIGIPFPQRTISYADE